MTSESLSPIEDESVFRTELHKLLLRAHAGEIPVVGGWACLNGDGTPSWDVEVITVDKTDTNEVFENDGSRSE